MHCVYLGPVMLYVAASLWRLILKNVWGLTCSANEVVEVGAALAELEGEGGGEAPPRRPAWQERTQRPAALSELCR